MTEHIYIITAGTYSDYRILGVAKTKELAEKFADKWGGEVEEWIISDNEDLAYIQDKEWFNIFMNKEGNSYSQLMYESNNEVKTKWKFWEYYTLRFELFVCTWANDEERAVKIANEIRTQLIASGEWEREELKMENKKNKVE